MKKNQTKKRIKARRLWNRNPKTRVKESEKEYKRPRAKQETKKVVKESI